MVSNKAVLKVFTGNSEKYPAALLNARIKAAIQEELPNILPIDELDAVQWDYVYGQIDIMVADALQMKNKFLKED